MTVTNMGVKIFFSDLEVGACIFQENMSIETFNISIESTRISSNNGTKITSTEVRKKSYGELKCDNNNKNSEVFVVLSSSPPFKVCCI